MQALVALLVAALLFRGSLMIDFVNSFPSLQTAATVCSGVFVQAMPFLVLGVLISGAIAAFVSPRMLRTLLPRRESVAVGVAGLAGAALPGCECGAVPVARRLIDQGAPSAAALTFLLSAPAINPVVLVATAVAFPGEPRMVLARLAATWASGWRTWCGAG